MKISPLFPGQRELILIIYPFSLLLVNYLLAGAWRRGIYALVKDARGYYYAFCLVCLHFLFLLIFPQLGASKWHRVRSACIFRVLCDIERSSRSASSVADQKPHDIMCNGCTPYIGFPKKTGNICRRVLQDLSLKRVGQLNVGSVTTPYPAH